MAKKENNKNQGSAEMPLFLMSPRMKKQTLIRQVEQL